MRLKFKRDAVFEFTDECDESVVSIVTIKKDTIIQPYDCVYYDGSTYIPGAKYERFYSVYISTSDYSEDEVTIEIVVDSESEYDECYSVQELLDIGCMTECMIDINAEDVEEIE